VIAGGHEQTGHTDLKDPELARIQRAIAAPLVRAQWRTRSSAGDRYRSVGRKEIVCNRRKAGSMLTWLGRRSRPASGGAACLQRRCCPDLPDDEGPFRYGAAANDRVRGEPALPDRPRPGCARARTCAFPGISRQAPLGPANFAAIQRDLAEIRDNQTSYPARTSPFFRDPSAGTWCRYPSHSGAAWSCQADDHGMLCQCGHRHDRGVG
jgi:hypothetical protein